MHVLKRPRILRLCLIVPGIFLVLGGCLETTAEDSVAEATVPERQITLSGSVGDGPVVGAAIVVTSADQQVLAEFESTMQGGYSVALEVTDAEFPLIVEATGGTDLVTNLAPDFDLSGAALASNSAAVANVNPFTTFAVETAGRLADGATAANIAESERLVVDALDTGLSIFAAQGPLATPVDETNIAEIVRASEALAEIVRRTRDRLAIPASEVIAALSADVTDGVVDGIGAPGVDPRTAAVSSLITAQVLLETMTNTLFVNGSNAMSAMEDAILQVSEGTPQPSVQDLAATASVLDRTWVRLSAAWSITADPDISELAAAVDRMQAGMPASLARVALPSDFRTRLDAAIALAASGDSGVVDTVNTVVRQGGTEILPGNTTPQISGNPPATVAAGNAYNFTPDATDPDDDLLTFSISGSPDWATFEASSGRLSGTPAISDAGTYANIRISVSDGIATATLPAFSIDVSAGNSTPTISGSPADAVAVDAAYMFVPTANDPDGDTLTFSIESLPDWATFDPSNGRLAGTPGSSHVGSYLDIVISVSDGQRTASLSPFTINVVADNLPPSISGSGAATIEPGQDYEFQPTASDPDGDTLSFSISNQPSWASFDPGTGRLVGTATAADEGTFGNIIIRANDGELTASLAAFAIIVAVPNTPPTIGGTPETQVDAGTLYSFTPGADDTDGDGLSFSIAGRPSWASFSQSTGRVWGTPVANDAGTYSNIRISVSDGTDATTLPAFSITVIAPANSAPTINGNPPASVSVNTAYSFTPTANDANGDPLTFSISGRPAWASFNTSTGRLSGTPGNGDVGTYSDISIAVTDGSASASLPAFSITVMAPANTAPTISGNPPTSVIVNTAYSFMPTANDTDSDPLTFSISGQPGWASFNTSTGRLSGTPGDGDVGTDGNIVIMVSDGTASASLPAFSITVMAPANTAPTIGGNPPASVTANTAYSFTPTANDADGDPLTFSISAKPDWASFNTSTGRLSGTPGDGDVGTDSNIVILVSDGTASASLPAFSITVTAPPNTAPTISGNPPASVTVNTAYSFTPTAIDADSDPLTFSISGQPGWASFNTSTGRLSGTPGAADVGTYNNILITVSDGMVAATLGPFAITVDAVSNGSATLSWTPPTQNTDGSSLTDLAGYKLYWRNSGSSSFTNSVTINNPSVTTYIVENLAPGTYDFVATAFNSASIESNFSSGVTHTVQ